MTENEMKLEWKKYRKTLPKTWREYHFKNNNNFILNSERINDRILETEMIYFLLGNSPIY